MCLLCLDEVEFRPASVLKMEEKHNELMKQMKRKFEETTKRGSHNVYNVWVLVYSVFVHKVFFFAVEMLLQNELENFALQGERACI